MSKTIEQLRAQAAQIEEATRQGENTQIRVGGLFTDVIDFIAQIPVTETVLGPLLTALNNSGLLEPSDGQTLTFSIMKEGWTYSDALTQLKLSINGIEQTVTSNYEAFLLVKDQLQREVAATDQRVRSYKTDYDNSQIEYATWKSQTDTQISQYAVAIDKNTGDIISISGRVDTAYDQLDFVTNDLEAADRAIGKLFDLTGMELTDDPSASWLYKNRAGIYGAAATFDENGNIKQSSKLQVTINGIETEVSNATGQISSIKQSVDSIQLAVAGSQQQITTLSEAVNGSPGHPGILDRLSTAESGISGYADSAAWIQLNRDRITATVGYFDEDGKLLSTAGLVETGDFAGLFATAYDNTGAEAAIAEMSVSLSKKINREGVEELISEAIISADNVQFTFTRGWNVINGNTGETVMWLEPSGDLHITGDFYGNIVGDVDIGSGTRKMRIEPIRDIGARLVGITNNQEVLELGFVRDETGTITSALVLEDAHFTPNQLLLKRGGNKIYLDLSYTTSRPELILYYGDKHANLYYDSYGRFIIETLNWPTNQENLNYGSVWVDSQNNLKVYRG